MIEALDIRVKGIVQGVGFRPFIYRLAKRNLITGWVLNGQEGVFIHAEGESNLLDSFVMSIVNDAPAAAQVSEVDMTEVPLQDCETFEIRRSDKSEAAEVTLVSPDLAVCDDCLRELFDPSDKRFRYPFINCTNCGPRFTIIEGLPYDRAATSMKRFPMCSDCSREYHDPLNRRFHAQPDACFDCGPAVCFAELSGPCSDVASGKEGESAACSDAGCPASGCSGEEAICFEWASNRAESDAIFARAVDMLLQGKILAVKGLGGFHLVCDAQNEQAVAALRARKHRDGKAFAVMLANAEVAREFCEVSEVEQKRLEGVQRPIVLLRKRSDATLVSGLADKLPELGVMLPSTPVQHLLMADFMQAGGTMLVMTSGNMHDEPIVTDDVQACSNLAGIADAVLGNNRAILQRFDDSVLRVLRTGVPGNEGHAVQMIRRARGYAPQPLMIPQDILPDQTQEGAVSCSQVQADCSQGKQVRGGQTACLLATGPEQKNTFTLLQGARAFVSQHIGDLEDLETFDAWTASLQAYQRLFALNPSAIVSDLHPSYFSTQWAQEQVQSSNCAHLAVQHHHAHVASVMAENGLSDAVCGIAFDGTGYGTDGAVWGGEVLLANLSDFERLMNFAYVPMPGAAAAIKNPLRMAYGALWAFDLLEHPAAADLLHELGSQAQLCQQMIDTGLNTPMTSSVGRLFDAASALLGLCSQASYEGEPAILLESALWEDWHDEGFFADELLNNAYPFEVVKNAATDTSTAQDTSVLLFDAASAFEHLLDDKAAGVATSLIARRFHNGMAGAVLMAARCAEALYGIRTVVLSGGVFMNRYLMEASLFLLQAEGFTVAIGKDLPPNDGGLSFGQAIIGASHEGALG